MSASLAAVLAASSSGPVSPSAPSAPSAAPASIGSAPSAASVSITSSATSAAGASITSSMGLLLGSRRRRKPGLLQHLFTRCRIVRGNVLVIHALGRRLRRRLVRRLLLAQNFPMVQGVQLHVHEPIRLVLPRIL